MKTDDCVHDLIENNHSKNIVIMNFASRKHAGGGYVNGATAQEEDLCRVIPILYQSLKTIKYPFGDDSILLSKKVAIYRDSEKYNILPDKNKIEVSVVSAAAQNLRIEDFNEELVIDTLKNIFISVIQHLPETDTLILGAWGCGAFRNDPIVMSKIMNNITQQYGGYYKNIIYAIPSGPNASVFNKFIKQTTNF
jgi:uncharacterized protein (TIGR02452 family)